MRVKRHILCLDVSLRNIGYAVFDFPQERILCVGVMRTQRKKGTRLADNFRCLSELLAQLDAVASRFSIAFVLAEFPTGGSMNAHASNTMGLVTGMLFAWLKGRHYHFKAIRPMEIKRLIRPKGAVSKEDVQDFVRRKYGSSVLPKQRWREHIADAIACYDAFARR